MSPLSQGPKPLSNDALESTDTPDLTLATWAIGVSSLLGVSPFGHDLLFAASRAESPLPFIGASVLFLAAMVTPLIMLYRQSRFRAIGVAPIRIGVSCFIIALNACFYVTITIRLL